MGISKTPPRLSIAGVCVLAALLAAVVPATGTAKAAEKPSQVTAALGWKIVPTEESRNVVTPFSDVTVAVPPTLCHPRDEDYNRFADCDYSEWISLVIDTKTGEVVGTVSGATILWNNLAYNSRSWQEHIQLRIGTITGEGARTTITAPIECSPGSTSCVPTGQGLWAGEGQYLPVKDGDIYNGELGWESPGISTNTMSFEVAMVFNNEATANGYASLTVGPTEEIRCDSLAVFKPTKGGCVYLHYTKNFFTVSTADKTVTTTSIS